MEGVEEELRLAIEPGRHRGVAGRGPLAGRLEQRVLLVDPADDRRGECGGAPVFLCLEQPADEAGIALELHRQRPRPDAVRIVLPEKMGVAAAVDEDVRVDDAAGRWRRRWIEPKFRWID